MTEETLGQQAYQSYKRNSKRRSLTGRKLPAWAKLTDAQRIEWEAAAQHILMTKAKLRGGPHGDE